MQASHAGPSRVQGEEGQAGHVAVRTVDGITPLVTANLKYYGAKVVPNAKVIQVLYGTGTYAAGIASGGTATATRLGDFYSAIMNSPYVDWLSEYNTVGLNGQDGLPGFNQTIGRGTWGGMFQITPLSSRNGSTITDAQIQAELLAQINAGSVPANDQNTIYMINFPAGKTISQGSSSSCVAGGFCAYHGTLVRSGVSVYYGVLPDMSASSGCATGCGNDPSAFNNQTSVASHELIETITDAEVGIGTQVARPLAWYDTAGGEIGDICNAQQGTINGWVVQKEWSNQAGACIVQKAVASNDFSISLSPTSRTTGQGTTTTYTVSTAVVSGSAESISLSVSAGLPSGVTASFSPASVTAGGSSTLTLTVSGSAAAATSTFTVRGNAASATHTVNGSLTVTAPGGAFPESAHPYANNFDFTWTFTLPGSPASINVTFDAQTKVENTFDFIYVMDKNGVNISGSPFTNTTLAGATKNVVGDTVKIRLTTDSSVTFYGFKVTNVTAGGGGGDTTPPTTSVTAPSNGATVSGTTTVSATASDNVGVTKMEIYIDGALATSNTNSTSLLYSWNTTAAANGSHTIQSKAYDAANNVGSSSTISVTVSNSTSCTPQQLVVNGGFETGTATPWTASTGVVNNSASEAAHSGSWKTWMNGYGSAHTDTLTQTVTIPSCATTATFTFWLHIDTAETSTTTIYDTLSVQVKSTGGTVLGTLATYSNLNAASGYMQRSFSLASYKGQTIVLSFTGSEDSTLQTSFVIDDVALNVQ